MGFSFAEGSTGFRCGKENHSSSSNQSRNSRSGDGGLPVGEADSGGSFTGSGGAGGSALGFIGYQLSL
jgi:hypothetical protein